LRALLRVR